MTHSRVAIVTGASRGIGAATALLLASRGYGVCVNYAQGREKAEAVVARIIDTGGRAMAYKADMGREEEILAMFAAVDSGFGPITTLVNNAAQSRFGAVENLLLAEIRCVFEVNVFGTFIACREAIKRMKRTGGGGIVNVSSQAAVSGGNKMAHYAASKAAVNTLTVALAREVAGDNIRVNAISPAIIDTDAHKGGGEERRRHLHSTLPMGRMGTPEEAAQTIAWLLSDQASYVSGAILPVSGAR